jgi:hypothetical protein
MPYYGEPGIVAELARHSAWLAHAKLQEFIHSAQMSNDAKLVKEALQDALLDVTAAVKQIEKFNSSSK